MTMEDLVPSTNIEWFVVADVAGLFSEIQRFTGWKGAILAAHRRAALESALELTHFASAAPNNRPMRIIISRQEAEQWRTDPEKRGALNKRLAEHGYDEETLNAGALIEAMVPLATIERFLASARKQLNARSVYAGSSPIARARRSTRSSSCRRKSPRRGRSPIDQAQDDLDPQNRIQQAQCLPQHRSTDCGR
jgi:hypothetical protein